MMQQSSESTPPKLQNDEINKEKYELPKIFDYRNKMFENYMKNKEEINEGSDNENVESNKAVILLQDENKLEAEVSSNQSSLMTVVKEKIAEIICNNNRSTRLEKCDNLNQKKV